MVGEAVGDGVADVVEAGLSHSSQSPPSFHLIQLSSPQLVQNSLSRIFFRMFSEKTHCGWLMKIFIHQHKLV